MVSNLPEVGKNLFDHLLLPLYVDLEARVSVTLYKLQTVPEVLSYFVYGRGMIFCIISNFSIHSCYFEGWYATNGIMAVGRANDSGVMLFGMGSTDEKILRSLSNYKTEVNETRRCASFHIVFTLK